LDELSIRITGEAGQGLQTIGEVLCRMFKSAGYHIFANQDNMSRIRGGNNYFQLRVSSKPAYTLRKNPDIIVCLDKASVSLHANDLAAGGMIIADKNKLGLADSGSMVRDVPLSEMAKQAAGKELFINSVACGVIAALAGVELDFPVNVIRGVLSDKAQDMIDGNIASVKKGFEFARGGLKSAGFKITPGQARDNFLMTATDAMVLAAVKAGCKFYSAYPMSPSTGIMTGLAGLASKFGIHVEQAEDEIAAINMIIGASFAGARSMAATSGGGFALMVEGLSLAGMTETPIVVAVAQRPGPATGFPTRTEQADLDFILSAGHGEFARAIYTPGSIEEAFDLTVKAFNIAEKYQVPVIILTDQHIAECYQDIERFDQDKIKPERYIISQEESLKLKDYKRYLLTESGISPRAIPSWSGAPVYADSDEHTEEGHITEDARLRVKMVEKRWYKKMRALEEDLEEPVSGDVEGAKIVLLGFGSTLGTIREAAEASKGRIGFVHLPQVWPFPKDKLIRLLKNSGKIITVENNASAQLAKLLRRETGISAQGSILKFDGRPFNLDHLTERLKEFI